MSVLNANHLTVRQKNAVPSNCKLKYLEGKKYKTSQIYPKMLNKKQCVRDRKKEDGQKKMGKRKLLLMNLGEV